VVSIPPEKSHQRGNKSLHFDLCNTICIILQGSISKKTGKEKLNTLALLKELGEPLKVKNKLFVMLIPGNPLIFFEAGFYKFKYH